MFRVFRSTWITLRRRSLLLGTFGASAAFALLATGTTILNASTTPAATVGPGPKATTIGSLGAADGPVIGLGNATQFLGVIAVAVAALVIGNAYQHGTLRTLLVREPHRLRLLGGMWLATASFVAIAALIATAVSIATAFALAPGKGVDTSAWTSAAGLEHLAAAGPQMVLALVGYATFGAAVAVITRSSTVAIAIGVAWLLPVESILVGTLDSAADALPGQVLQAVAQGGTASIALGAGLAGALAWAVCAGGLAGWFFRTRDATS